MASITLDEGNSYVVQHTLTNGLTSEFINDATVTGRIDDIDDNIVVATFDMDYVTSSDGIYRATNAPDSGIISGERYKVIIDAVGSDSLIGHWSCGVTATTACDC